MERTDYKTTMAAIRSIAADADTRDPSLAFCFVTAASVSGGTHVRSLAMGGDSEESNAFVMVYCLRVALSLAIRANAHPSVVAALQDLTDLFNEIDATPFTANADILH